MDGTEMQFGPVGKFKSRSGVQIQAPLLCY